MRTHRIEELIAEAFASEHCEAKEAGALGFVARGLTQATMPHRAIVGSEFVRANGAFTLSILAPSHIGLPYGTIPRLLIAWLTTEAVRTRERELVLGKTLTAFMAQLGLVPTGGRWGSITRLRTQARRLFAATISCLYDYDNALAEFGFRVADRQLIWWDPASRDWEDEQTPLFQSTVVLSRQFFDEITASPVPIDMRALHALRRSPLALDIYCWLTYRMSYLRRQTDVPWAALAAQFGSNYGQDSQGLRNFRRAFVEHLSDVCAVYPHAKVEPTEAGLRLRPSLPHVPRIVLP